MAYNQEEKKKKKKKRKSHSLIFVSSSIRLTSRLGMSEGMSKLSESLTYLKCLPNTLFEKFMNYIICIRAPAYNYRLGCILAMLSDPRAVGGGGWGSFPHFGRSFNSIFKPGYILFGSLRFPDLSTALDFLKSLNDDF